jgi:Phage tail tube protein
LSASIASGRLSEVLNELSRAELEFIAHDSEIWARDEQLAPPPLVIPGEPLREARDPGSQPHIRDYAFNGTVRDWQVIVPDFGTIQGAFQITSLEFSGRHDAEMTFDISLESAGELTFTAAL